MVMTTVKPCVVTGVLLIQAFIWNFISRNHHISGKNRIQARLVEFTQVTSHAGHIFFPT